MNHETVRVLVVDDSLLYRTILSKVLKSLPGVEVVGTALDGRLAITRVARLKPDLITMDIEMPVMNGIDTLRVMKDQGLTTPVIMVSSLTVKGASVTMEALNLGAFDFITKPDESTPEANSLRLREQLKPILQAVRIRLRRRSIAAGQPVPVSKPVHRPPAESGSIHRPGKGRVEVVALGISTGGPNALNLMLPRLPEKLGVPMMIVQHMPAVFTKALADTLDGKSTLTVTEAEHGMAIRPDHVYIAPGGRQMKLRRQAGSPAEIVLTDDPPENYCKPSADYLFRSVAEHYGNRSLGVIMTGMGNDGAAGLKSLYQTGARIMAQDENSCTVFGMPREAIELGVVDEVVPLEQIAGAIVRQVRG